MKKYFGLFFLVVLSSAKSQCSFKLSELEATAVISNERIESVILKKGYVLIETKVELYKGTGGKVKSTLKIYSCSAKNDKQNEDRLKTVIVPDNSLVIIYETKDAKIYQEIIDTMKQKNYKLSKQDKGSSDGQIVVRQYYSNEKHNIVLSSGNVKGKIIYTIAIENYLVPKTK